MSKTSTTMVRRGGDLLGPPKDVPSSTIPKKPSTKHQVSAPAAHPSAIPPNHIGVGVRGSGNWETGLGSTFPTAEMAARAYYAAVASSTGPISKPSNGHSGLTYPNPGPAPQFHPSRSTGPRLDANLASAPTASSLACIQLKDVSKRNRVSSPLSNASTYSRDYITVDADSSCNHSVQLTPEQMPADLEAIEAWIDSEFSESEGYAREHNSFYEKLLKQVDSTEEWGRSSVLHEDPILSTYGSPEDDSTRLLLGDDLWYFS